MRLKRAVQFVAIDQARVVGHDETLQYVLDGVGIEHLGGWIVRRSAGDFRASGRVVARAGDCQRLLNGFGRALENRESRTAPRAARSPRRCPEASPH